MSEELDGEQRAALDAVLADHGTAGNYLRQREIERLRPEREAWVRGQILRYVIGREIESFPPHHYMTAQPPWPFYVRLNQLSGTHEPGVLYTDDGRRWEITVRELPPGSPR